MSKQTKQTKSAPQSSKNTKDAKETKSGKQAAAESTGDDFISEDSLGGGSANYLSLEKGTRSVRIISKPITGWVEWIEKKPVRTTLEEGEPEASDDENPPKKFIALVVIDREDDGIKIWEITQQSIIKAIRALSMNSKWGPPFTYDISIEKTGDGLKTKYTVTPEPKEPVSKELIEAANEKPCDLEKLFEGEDPWKVTEHVTEYHFRDTGKR